MNNLGLLKLFEILFLLIISNCHCSNKIIRSLPSVSVNNSMNKLMYITVPTKDMGKTIAMALVQEKLAACVNIMNSEVESYYMWNGTVETGSEHILFVKTVKANVPLVIARTKELHSYEVPCVLSFSIDDGDATFMKWIQDNSGGGMPAVDSIPSSDSGVEECDSAISTAPEI